MLISCKNIAVFFTLFCLCAKGQETTLSCYEKRWAFFHPFAATTIKKTAKRCFVIYRQASLRSDLDHFENGGRIDAFRHAFFTAAFSQKINARKVRKLGKLHEKGNYRDFKKGRLEDGELPDSLGTVMDLKNNELGIAIGIANKQLSLEDLSKLVLAEINNGQALIMNRKRSGVYLDCQGQVIATPVQTKKWNIPKCLVRSNITYID